MVRSAASHPEPGHDRPNGPSGAAGKGEENTESGQHPSSTKHAEPSKKKPSKFAGAWAKLGLDVPTVLMMMKSALPPTIALAMYQADDVATTYSTLGYLVAIIAVLGFAAMPRAKFIQTMSLNIIATCFASALNLLACWTGVQARIHTTPTGSAPRRYNPSQSVVMGIWLFSQIYLVNALKAKYPQFAFPTIIWNIFVNVAGTYGPRFVTTAQAESFIYRLLISFLTGLGIATGVSLFIVPVSSRTVVVKEITGYLGALRGSLQAHKKYLQSLETAEVYGNGKAGKGKLNETTPEIEAVKKLTATFSQLYGKLHGDLPFAKREIAYGKLTPDDFESISKHLRSIMLPMVGLGSLVDLFNRHAEISEWYKEDGTEELDLEEETIHQTAVEQWNDIMKLVHDPFEDIIQSMDEGLEHVLLRLQFVQKPKKTQKIDEESKGSAVHPGDPEFASYFQRKCEEFDQMKETTLREWVESKGFDIGADFFHEPSDSSREDTLKREPTRIRQGNQRQLFVLLYIIYLLHSISLAIHEFVKFADERDQSVAKSKLILPGKKRFKKWIRSLFNSQDMHENDETIAAGLERDGVTVYMGEAYNKRHDPEHLPPRNAWEKLGNKLRTIPAFLRSPESSFGFRTACATMTIAIIAYLRDTQDFFVQHRLVWAMIMVALSMTPTAGQSVFSFFLRILGTLGAMVVAFLVWYIPAQHTAGIIVCYWVFMALAFYIPLKRFDLIIVGIISVTTLTMIIGYELEVRKIGVKLATSNGQPYYPLYLLGPYRLATVVGGLAVAFIWTFFPFPISEHSALRQKLGGSLYLAANFYSIIHETVMARIRGDEGELMDPTSPGYQLTKARYKVFAKQMLLLQGLRTHSAFIDWEFPLGGKFPRKEYNEIIQLVTNISNYTALISYASQTFSLPLNSSSTSTTPHHAQWFTDFRTLIRTANLTSHEITSMLALLSSSITNGQPLPPYLVAPQAYQLTRRLEAIDKEILNPRWIAEPGYAAFAVLQICTGCVGMDVRKLLKAVKGLVGELDFSFHVVSTRNESGSSSRETLAGSAATEGRDKQD
ncbi:hypothetical protein B0J11DRAFT_472026 [Dendryphion nanum]|uniref:ER transporter 6TM N-terminal domain-containing protein n=1 Tax=Dendryphion nanum TaxID=256645 RepID=A0A9P9D7F5_9PLEO|nr:hypothetical protein B0J11DRAFT_472026 [Dendryphion nanum]